MFEQNLLDKLSGQQVRSIIIEQSKRAHVGHIGSCLSVADIISALYQNVLQISDPDDPERDRFILSKGHAALALYAALHLKGWLSQEALNTFCTNGTLLGTHPEHTLTGVDFSTGSLGQGLSIAAGSALAAKLQGSPRRAFALLSDAEFNEGSVWEAIMFASHHQLSNLVVIVDLNGQQALGYTSDVLNINPLADRLRAFNWNVYDVDGHNESQIQQTIQRLENNQLPHVLLAHTTFGKGVSYMESQIKWHYYPMSDEEYEQAITEVNSPQ